MSFAPETLHVVVLISLSPKYRPCSLPQFHHEVLFSAEAFRSEIQNQIRKLGMGVIWLIRPGPARTKSVQISWASSFPREVEG